MFPTFISILDIQSWWEVPSIAHFCSLFRSAFNLLDFDIEDLEEALLTDGTEETSWLQELIVRLLTGCLPNNEISTFNYQMFLRRLFREKCKEHDRYNPFNTDIDFQLLPLRTKVDILHALCDFRLDAEDVLEQLKNLEADSLRVEPLGYDNNDSAYWYFYGTRLYREDFKTKNNKKGKSVWQVVCFTEDDWFQLAKKFKKSQSKSERQLYRTLTENFLPELPRLFCEKERLARKRLLENQPRRTSSRLGSKRKQEIEQAEKAKLDTIPEKETEEDEETRKKRELERRRQEAFERRARLRDKDRESEEKSESRYEMAGNKKREKRSKPKPRQHSNSSSSSRDRAPSVTRTSSRAASRSSTRNADSRSSTRNADSRSSTRNADSRSSTRNADSRSSTRNADSRSSTRNADSRSSTRNADKTGTSKSSTDASNVSNATTVGRQTNNSLASATGQIVIQPVSNPHRKKLKTSQVFRQTEEDLQTGMHKILDYVKNHEDAWPFIDPVEEEYAPNYYSIIRKPMDLQRMEERLDSGYYKSFSRFRGDFQLIVDNCRLYNGVDNEYTEMVGNLLTVFEKATERYLDQVTSSDEEIAVEYPEISELEEKVTSSKLKKIGATSSSSTSNRKPTLAAQTDKKREPSLSEESISKRSNSIESFDQIKSDKKPSKVKEEPKSHKKNAKHSTKTEEKQGKNKPQKNVKADRKPSKLLEPTPVRSRSRSRSFSSLSREDWSSSPPPSWPPSSPESRLDFPKKKNSRSSLFSDDESRSKFKGRGKQKDKWKDVVKDDHVDKKHSKTRDRSPSPPKQKDKHNKLRETIEKLKAKSEISNKLKEKDHNDSDNDKAKENHDASQDLQDNKSKKQDLNKNKFKHKAKAIKNEKRTLEFEDENSTADSVQSENKKHLKKDSTKNSGTKNAAIEALTLATEQTLKDINKWLDDTPRLSEFSSASNSPSHYIGAEEFDSIGSKIEHDYRKRLEKPLPKKDALGKDIKRRTFHRDPTKFLKKREVQRTIDRLQPGKSKGNLLSNIQNTNKADDIFPLGPLSKIKDTKNSLIVKTDESTPKLSLGSVLDSFGKHKFVDDVKKEEESDKSAVKKESCTSDSFATKFGTTEVKSETTKAAQAGDKKEKVEAKTSVAAEMGSGKATPNLSAWFKAFGAPKVLPNPKKSESKPETKETEKSDESSSKPTSQEQKPKEESRKITPPDISPNPDSPATPQGQPAPRQRKMSTGSTVSERSSFSQDMDSPQVGIDERLGAYPAPYPSPLHRSPSGASPVMASPRPDVSPKSAYPTVNGQIRVGFYQDTVSTKSSPDKSCSPRDNPQSPYPQYSEHVYTPSTTENATYSYNNPAYYSQQISNYSNPTTPSYNPAEQQTSPASYYDTNKPLTDQYQAKAVPSYHSPNFPNVNSPNYSANSPGYHPTTANSPGYHSPAPNVQLSSPAAQQPSGYDSFRQQQATRLPEKQQTTMFPVKKRAYNESDAPQLPNSNQQEQLYDRNYEMSLMSGRQLNIETGSNTAQAQEVRPSSRGTPQQYVHQNIPNPRSSNSNPNAVPAAIQASRGESVGTIQANSFTPAANVYNYSNETEYPVNAAAAERPLDLNARPDAEKKVDMTKYTNMGYTDGADIGFSRNASQYNLNYGRPLVSKPGDMPTTAPTSGQNVQSTEMMMRYGDATGYRNADMTTATQKPNLNMSQSTESRLNPSLDVPSGYKPEMSIPRPGYTTPSTLNMDQSLGLRGNLTNLIDRFSTENMYYAEKGLAAPHIYSKPMVTSTASLPMFSQSSIAMPYSHEMQATQSSMYNRQMTELPKTTAFPQPQEKKSSKRRKSSKTPAAPTSSGEPAVSSASNQGFQSYTGLKNTEPSAISLKTASVVPGSAFNFGPAPTGLGLSSGLYGDKDTYPNFLEDYRAAPNYYMAAAAAAAHHRSTPEAGDKQARTPHQPSASTAAGYPFIGAPQARPPSYPFMPPHQAAPLMDASSPLYQQYLQAGVLHQGLLGPPGAYPPGYHPALSMRQPFDSMTRPSWL